MCCPFVVHYKGTYCPLNVLQKGSTLNYCPFVDSGSNFH